MTLQWGRRLSTAEIDPAFERLKSELAELQWGRRLSTAEITSSRRRGRPFDGLQWGRRLSTAEIQQGVVGVGLQEVASMGPPSLNGGNW